MDKMGRSYSKAAVTGFILAVTPVVIYTLVIFADMFFRKAILTTINREIILILTDIGVTAFIMSFVAGFVLSIVGLITSIRKRLKGKALAIISLVIYQLEMLMAAYAILLSLAMAFSGGI